MTLRLAPPLPPEPVSHEEHEDFDHDFFRAESLAPIEVDADGTGHDGAGKPRSAVRTALGALGSLAASLVIAFLCIYMLVPNTGEEGAARLVLPSEPPHSTPAAAAAPAPIPPAPAQPRAPVPQPPAVLVAAPPAALPAPTSAPTPAAIPTKTPARARHAAFAPASTPTTAADSGDDALVKAAFRSLSRGDAQTAIAKARRVVDASPERADAWLVLGSAYGKLQDAPSAKLAFRACALRGKGPEVATCVALAR